ncbi:MAG: hypothetical protein ABJE47_21125 [bacterium]
MPFSKEDWEHLMSLCQAAPERYAERVLEEASAMIKDDRRERRLRLFGLRRLLREHREREVRAFNPDKSGPIDRLTALLSLDLLSDADLDGFSPEVRGKAVRLRAVLQMSRDVVPPDPDDDEELPPPRMLEVRGREVEVRVLTGLSDGPSEARGEPPCHVGIEVEYRGEAKIIEVVQFDRIPAWGKIAFEVDMWIGRNDPWGWEAEAAH